VDRIPVRRHQDLNRPGAIAQVAASLVTRDVTNWVGPDPAAVIAMLRDVGFRHVETVWRPRAFPRRLARTIRDAAIRREPLQLARINQSRCVVHAWS
jgi:hypothetical protein